MIKHRIFIGSSTEKLDVARKIKRQFDSDPDITAVVWKDCREFYLGESVLESLMNVKGNYDFAILVFNPDDKTESRGEVQPVTRDNVLFELGLFMGVLGRKRTFFVYNSDDNVKIPSDLKGITSSIYKTKGSGEGLLSDISSAVDQIRDQVRREGPLPRVDPVTTQAGIFNRIINASMSPNDDYIESEFLEYVNSQRPESIASIKDVVAFSRDLFRYYLYPFVRPSELRDNYLRIYFAYFLGDGVPVKAGCCPTDCSDVDLAGKQFKGHFVIGLSNPSPLAAEKNWLEGRVVAGYDEEGGWLSNCAWVFARGKENNIANVEDLSTGEENFQVEGEKAVYTLPIHWSIKRDGATYKATIGVLAVSSKQPYGVQKYIRTRANALSVLLGFLFSLHAFQSQDKLDEGFSACPQAGERPIGFNPRPPEDFARRAVALRRKIALHFESSFLRKEMHVLKDGQLSFKH